VSDRTIRGLHRAVREDFGELVTRHPIPSPSLERLDPFLLLNHHGPQRFPPHNGGLPFGPHPHRGFETVTFIVDGELLHRDSEGHESVIGAGGVQWMTAGRGVTHAEVSPPEFLERGGDLDMLQLWINLPARLKMTEPKYTGLQREAIPSFSAGGATVHLIAGDWNGERGPVESLTGVTMMRVDLSRGARITLPAPAPRTVLLYMVRGAIQIGGSVADTFNLVDLNDDGDAVTVEAVGGALLLFGHADPIREPVVAYGPFVMSTQQEILQAIRDFSR